jgi:subtilisin family serine protease
MDGELSACLEDRPVLDQVASTDTVTTIDVEIELYNASEVLETIHRIEESAGHIGFLRRVSHDLIAVSASIQPSKLLSIAGEDLVLFIGPSSEPRLLDERSDQIVASNLTADRAQPSGLGYAGWLAARQLDTPSVFSIDVSDTGIDRGSALAKSLHPDFLDLSGNSRVSYMADYIGDGQPDDRRGHGTLVASIAAGNKNGGITDDQGYSLGLGVAPGSQIGVSRIFGHDGKLPARLDFGLVFSKAYAAGARISNCSWGQGGNSYDSVAQQLDSLVRDAQADVPGNQELTFVFAAGNDGPGGHINSPGNAKNVITVGASENYRPETFDNCNLDGQGGVGPDGADNAMDILRYSSGGPTADGRSKPDIIAPGTHIFGAESQSPLFDASGLCQGPLRYGPPTQRLYTYSSGTSLSTPHVAGAAALVRQFFAQRTLLDGSPPSPAMIKAYLINSTSYLTGANAGGDLPGANQGWGLLDLSRAFDSATRILVDQTHLFTESGQTFQITGSLADRSLPLRITLAWTDAPGMLAGGAWVNNLDLELVVGGGATIYLGNNFSGAFSIAGGQPDGKNNVESIILPPDAIPAGAESNFTIVIRATNIAGDGVPGNGIDLDQDFALVAYNVGPPIIPPPTITSASYAAKVLAITGLNFGASARVEINGQLIELSFTFDASANALSIRAKKGKLNLNPRSNNQIVLIDNGLRSPPFTLAL